MKRIVIIIILILLTGCEQYQPTSRQVSVIVDNTDGENGLASFEKIKSYMTKGHSSDGLLICLRYVSETRYASSYEFNLPMGATGLSSNEDSRRRKKKRLIAQFKDTLESKHTEFTHSSKSEIFRLVVDEANKISENGYSGSLLLFSDLKEHSFFSVYNKLHRKKLLENPEFVAEEFLKQVNFNDNLQGISIYILHTPRLEDDAVFTAMTEVYRIIFESRGAKLITTQTTTVRLRP